MVCCTLTTYHLEYAIMDERLSEMDSSSLQLDGPISGRRGRPVEKVAGHGQ
jgi:hypothetical protein